MAERAEIRVLYVNGDFAELNRRLGQELAHDAEAFTTTLANLPKLLKMAEKKQLMGPSLGMEAQARLGAVDEDVDTHPHLPDTMQSKEGKAVLREIEQSVTKLQSRLTKEHRLLYEVAKAMNEKGATSRPAWANGAHVFVTPSVANHCSDLKKELEEYKTSKNKPVGKGCVLVSDRYLEIVKTALHTKTQGTPAKKFKLEEQKSIFIGPIRSIDTFRGGPLSLATRETKTTGDIPTSQLEPDSQVWNGKMSLGTGTHKKHLLYKAAKADAGKDVTLQAGEASEDLIESEEESSGVDVESRCNRPVDVEQLMKSMNLESDLADLNWDEAEHAHLNCLINRKFKEVIQAGLEKSVESHKSHKAKKRLMQRKLEKFPVPEVTFSVNKGIHVVAEEFRENALLFMKQLLTQEQQIEKKSGSSDSKGSIAAPNPASYYLSKGKGMPKKEMARAQERKNGVYFSRQQPSSASRT